jgi:murein DD-endopeptidase MepM/ murein hydrolase activator NlpD
MTRARLLLASSAALLTLVPMSAYADPASGARQGTPTPTSSQSSPAPEPAPDPEAAVIEQVRQRIGNVLADSLALQQHLADVMNQNTDEQDQIAQRLEASQARLDELDQQIEKLNSDIQTTQQRIDTEKEQISTLARALYEQPNSFLVRLLRAGSVRDVITETSDITAGAFRADALKKRLADDLDQMSNDQAARQADRDAESQASADLQNAQFELQSLASQEQATSDDLQASIDEAQSAVDGSGQQPAALLQQIENMLRKRQQTLIADAEREVWHQEQLWAALNRTTVSALNAFSLPARSGGGRFVWPERGAVITQGFGPSSLWLEPAMFGYSHFHTGIDLAAPYGAPIFAAADGVVAVAGSGTTGYGNYVIIVHGSGFATLYGHLAAGVVKAGDAVRQGQVIGAEGSTGASTGPHVHFEVRLNGTPVDPTPYLPPFGSA